MSLRRRQQWPTARLRSGEPKLAVDLGGRAFDHTERVHDPDRHALGTNTEIMQRPLGLCAPEPVGGISSGPKASRLNARPAGFTCVPWSSDTLEVIQPDGGGATIRRRKQCWSRAIRENSAIFAKAIKSHHFSAATAGRLFRLYSRLETGAGERFGFAGSLAPTGD